MEKALYSYRQNYSCILIVVVSWQQTEKQKILTWKVLSCVRGSVTNNNWFWTGFIGTSSQLQSIIALLLIYPLHKSLGHVAFSSSYSVGLLLFKVKVKVTLRPAVYRQSVYLGVKPLETHDQRFYFLQLSPCANSPYVTSSLTRRWGSLMNMLGLSSSVHFAHIACVLL
jgi:hypothetical protein